MSRFHQSQKIRSCYAKHPDFNAAVHVTTGLGIAFLVSLAWHYAVPVLVTGAIFLLAAIAMEAHASQ